MWSFQLSVVYTFLQYVCVLNIFVVDGKSSGGSNGKVDEDADKRNICCVKLNNAEMFWKRNMKRVRG